MDVAASLWSCNLDHFYRVSFPLHIEALIGRAVLEKMFENDSHLHLYSPGAGTDNPWGQNVF